MLLPTSTFMTPSTSQLTALRRAPLTEMLIVLVRPTPTSSARSLDTPGRQLGELGEVAVVDRQLLHLLRVDQVLHRRRRLHQRLAGDLDHLGHAAGRRATASSLDAIVDVPGCHARDDARLETRQRKGRFVGANRQQRQVR